MTKLYIIQEVGFEYNDEIYRKQDGGFPRRAFKDKKRAEEILLELSKDFYKGYSGFKDYYYGFCPGEYTYGEIEDICSLCHDEEYILNKLNTVFPKNKVDSLESIVRAEWRVKEIPTDKQIKVLSEVFDLIQPYEIIEIDYE